MSIMSPFDVKEPLRIRTDVFKKLRFPAAESALGMRI